jgi:hypothetical protein
MTLSTSTASEASRRKEEELADWWPERGGRSSGIPTSARKMRLLSKHSLSTSLTFQYTVVSTAHACSHIGVNIFLIYFKIVLFETLYSTV